jgi:uncharacterized protein YaiI (UPF0178 family)
MQIWLDGDACPKVVKEIIFRAVIRTKTSLILVANHLVPIPPSLFIKRIQVSGGFDVADQYIVDNLQHGDLVITADIPLADLVVAKGGLALNPRGELYTASNIKQFLSIRNFSESLRGSGVVTGGPSALDSKSTQLFANNLDKFLRQHIK